MSNNASYATPRILLELDDNDWVGRSVLAREAAYLFPQGQRNGPFTPTGRLICPASDCRTSFSRNADLLRHVATVHEVAKKFICPAVGCLKHGTTPPAFPRADKLSDHILAVDEQSHWMFTCHDVTCEVAMHMTLAKIVEHFEGCREGRELHGKSATRNALQRTQ
ncbi:hypothetical protein B0A48_05947 [Cryoendolithus antarcticus]|uniref:C2H2-type domain-containing protein n=1 Tax=Cryoendolithus antarcticus TaxID=1507870 RepID=A0A1V8TCF2_9PEZI|nr:hypothetical protein B0A48_05947 [Cryoendolithus antarcticus]